MTSSAESGCSASAGSIGIVDDDPVVGHSLSELLTIFGFEPVVYESAGALLEDARRGGLHCILIDFHMPGLDGLDLVSALRREGKAVPCLLITGRLDARITARANAFNLVAVLEKPFVGARLIELVRSAVAESRAADGLARAAIPPGASPALEC